MRRELERLLIVMGSVLMLSGCGNIDRPVPTATLTPQPSEPAATTTPTASPSPTLTEMPSSTPTVTPTRGPSPTPAPTPVFGSARVGNDFLFGNQPEGCELPCWQELRVGKSDAEDVQKAFETALGLSGMSTLPLGKAFKSLEDEPDWLILPQQWSFGEFGGTFVVGAWVRRDSLVLEAIEFYGDGSQFEPYVNPQHVLRKLGTPSHILVSLGITERADWANLKLLISYSKGITIYYGVRVVRVFGWEGSNPSVELCLGNIPKHPLTHIFLTRPLEDDDNRTLLSPLQYMGIDLDKVHMGAYQPFEEVFGVSLEEVTRLAQEKDTACVYAPAP